MKNSVWFLSFGKNKISFQKYPAKKSKHKKTRGRAPSSSEFQRNSNESKIPISSKSTQSFNRKKIQKSKKK